jgi:hypothetical protein
MCEIDDKILELDRINVREKLDFTELEIQRLSEDPAHMELERCCGNCCWFCFEQTDGEGQCPSSDGGWLFTNCGSTPCKDYISRQQMRHHMAVLLQYHRADENMNYRFPGGEALEDAVVFAYKYMKVFSKL